MKALLTLCLAGALGASAANDRMAEERYRTKYGRSTPAEEARQREEKAKRTSQKDCCCCKKEARNCECARGEA
jgi:hypothetical protein